MSAWYEPVEPPAELRHLLACTWIAHPTGEHLLTPDGCIDLLCTSTDILVLCGPDTHSWRFRLPEGTTAVGARFRPGAAHAVFGQDMSQLLDARVPLEVVLGAAAAAEWRRQLGAAGGLAQRRDTLAGLVADHAGATVIPPPAEAVVELLTAEPMATVGTVAAAIGMSPRTLHRHSLKWFGYGTATLARLMRFHRFLAAADAGLGPAPAGQAENPARAAGGSLAAAAAEAGYFDQAHLARDCRAITGLTPTAFLSAHFPTFPDMTDPYKTQRPLLATMGQ